MNRRVATAFVVSGYRLFIQKYGLPATMAVGTQRGGWRLLKCL